MFPMIRNMTDVKSIFFFNKKVFKQVATHHLFIFFISFILRIYSKKTVTASILCFYGFSDKSSHSFLMDLLLN